jgi:hypothetical protein
MYFVLKEELWRAGQLVLRGNRLVVPFTLRKQCIDLAHEGQQGIVRTMSRLSQKVWWPDMDVLAERKIKSCLACQVVGKNTPPEEIFSTPMPEKPWSY